VYHFYILQIFTRSLKIIQKGWIIFWCFAPNWWNTNELEKYFYSTWRIFDLHSNVQINLWNPLELFIEICLYGRRASKELYWRPLVTFNMVNNKKGELRMKIFHWYCIINILFWYSSIINMLITYSQLFFK